MAQYQNTSGSTVSVPEVSDYDVPDQAIIEVPDDVIMPPHYFTLVV